MKITKKQKTAFLKTKLSTNPAWATRALVRIFEENQTEDERSADSTRHDNGIGFSGVHANICSSFAKQLKRGWKLSDKQMVVVFKIIPKYHKQVASFIGDEKLNELCAKEVA